LIATSGKDHSIKLWRVADGKKGKAVATFTGHQRSAIVLAWTPDGATLVSGGADATVRFWDVRGRKASVAPLTLDDWVMSLAISKDGTTLLTGTLGGHAIQWNHPHPTPRRSLTPSLCEVDALAVTREGGMVVTGATDGSVRLWTTTGDLVRTLTVPPAPGASAGDKGVNAHVVALSADGADLATGTADGRILVWDVHAGTLRRTLTGHRNDVLGLRYLADGTLLSGGSDQIVRRWSTTGAVMSQTADLGHSIAEVAVTPDQRLVVTGCYDGAIRIHELATGTLRRTLTGHTRRVSAVEVSPRKTVTVLTTDVRSGSWSLQPARP
jgi:WD40 repeat protein